MATQEQDLIRMNEAMRRGDADAVAAILRERPSLVSLVSGRDLQRYLVDRPEMRDFRQEISTVNRATQSEAEAGTARNQDLMARLGVNPVLDPRFLQQSRAQAELEGANARAQTAADFQQRRNNPTRNAPVQQVLGAATEGFQRQSDVGATAAGATGVGLGIAAAIAGILGAPVTGGASLAAVPAALAPALGAAGTAIGTAGQLGQQATMSDANRRVASVGRQAASQAARGPNYAQMYPTLPTAAGPAEQALDLTGSRDQSDGFIYST